MDKFKERYKEMLSDRKKDNKQVAFEIGNTTESVNSVISQQIPRWLKLAIIQHEEDKKTIQYLKKEIEKI